MSNDTVDLPNDPAVLKAMIAVLQAENAKISATLRAHDQLVQALRLRIAKLTKQMFGKTSEKIGREIEQLELALEDLLVAVAEAETTPHDETEPSTDQTSTAKRHLPSRVAAPVCRKTHRASVGNWTRGRTAPIAVAICAWWAWMSASCSTWSWRSSR